MDPDVPDIPDVTDGVDALEITNPNHGDGDGDPQECCASRTLSVATAEDVPEADSAFLVTLTSTLQTTTGARRSASVPKVAALPRN